MSTSLRGMLSSAHYFALICISGLTISLIVSIIVYNSGIPAVAGDYVRLNLHVAGCEAVPTAIIATLHDFHTRAYQRRLEARAWTDELTGLLNRRFFPRSAHEECDRKRRTNTAAAIAIIDLDFFKEVHDLYGQAAGDRVRKSVAQIAHAGLRGPFDRLGRWGGEEFVVLLSDVTADNARRVCDRLRSRIQSALIETVDYQVCVTASFGFCMLGAGANVSSAIEAAGRALYEAKRLRRTRLEMGEYAHAEVQEFSEFKNCNPVPNSVEAPRDAGSDALRAAAIA